MTSRRIDIAATLAGLPAFPRLRGKRLQLRGPQDGDCDALFALFSDPDVMRYWSRAPMTTREEAAGLIAEIGEAFVQRDKLNWVMSLPDDTVIGTCTLFNFEPRHRRADVGYALQRRYWGQGLASEAVSLALDWGIRTLGLHRFEADIDPRNDASRKLLQRLGFRSEGFLRERYFVGDEVADTELLGLLAADWNARTR